MSSLVDNKGRVLIPKELRERLGLVEGVTVKVEEHDGEVTVAPTRKKRRTWSELNGLRPKRTGTPEWPTPEEIKAIWE